MKNASAGLAGRNVASLKSSSNTSFWTAQLPLPTLLISVNVGEPASALVERRIVELLPSRKTVVLLAHWTALSSVSAPGVDGLLQSARVVGAASWAQLAPAFVDRHTCPLLVTA